MANTDLNKENFNKELYSTANINEAVHTANIENEFVVVPQNVSTLRDVTPGAGSVSFSNGEYSVDTTATGSDTQALETARFGKYKPGLVAETGIYVRKSSDPVGIAEWGYGRDAGDDQIFFRYNSDGSLELVVKSGGTELTIPESDWDDNISRKSINDANGDSAGRIWGWDSMDGSGQSGINLDVSNGYIYKIVFSWYGGGSITFAIIAPSKTGYLRQWPIATFVPEGRISIEQPNQPVFARLDNDGTATADNLKVSGRQFAIFGTPARRHRESEQFNKGSTIGTSDTVDLLFRRKANREGVDIDVQKMTISTDQQVRGYTLINPALSSTASWSEPSDHNNTSEVAVEVDTSTSVDLGTGVKYGAWLVGSSKNTNALSDTKQFRFPVIRQNPVAVVMKSTTGSSATVDASYVFDEEW